MVDETKKIYTLDTIGTYCPIPIIKTAEFIQDIEIGEIIKVVSDDPGVVPDMEAWCKANGHKLIGHSISEEYNYIVYVEKMHL